MLRLLRVLLKLFALGVILIALCMNVTAAHASGWCNKTTVISTYPAYGTPASCPPYWCDPYADLTSWSHNYHDFTATRNWSWMYPHGGFTAYPGLPGSGVRSTSDYSQVNWTAPPVTNAQMVTQKLQSMGIPLVPQETIFLGKIPKIADNVKLPTPQRWIKPEEEKNNKNPIPNIDN